MSGAERGKFLSRVLGYEKIREAQERVRDKRRDLKHELDGLRRGMPNAEEVNAAHEAATAGLDEAHRQLEAALQDLQAARAEHDALEPRFQESEKLRQLDAHLTEVARAAQSECLSAKRDLGEVIKELTEVEAAEASIVGLRTQIEALPQILKECGQLDLLREAHIQREALLKQAASADAFLSAGQERLSRIRPAPVLLKEEQSRIFGLTLRKAEADSLQRTSYENWISAKAEADSRLMSLRERLASAQAHMHNLEQAGESGTCPTCARELAGEFGRAMGLARASCEEVEREIAHWAGVSDALRAEPAALAKARASSEEVAQLLAEAERRQGRCEAAAQELETTLRSREELAAKRDQWRTEAEALPPGYDEERHSALRREVTRVQGMQAQHARCEAIAGRRQSVTDRRARLEARLSDATDRAGQASEQRATVGFDQLAHDRLATALRDAREQARVADLERERRQGECNQAMQRVEAAARAQADLAAKRAECQVLDDEHTLHDELDAALTALRNELNSQIRPELAEAASVLLDQVTEGRYGTLEIDEDYEVRVFDAGKERPVISGGEEDVVNLVLRIALSQMIAERAGHPLTLLVLDEVFGSLDATRRDNVVDLLRRLGGCFEQVLVISHVDGLHDAMDHVIRLERDERTGTCSVACGLVAVPSLPQELALPLVAAG
jgi:DNA repair protein SbcC/Rad50